MERVFSQQVIESTPDIVGRRMMSPQVSIGLNTNKSYYKKNIDYDLFSDDARFDSHARLTHRRVYKKTVNLQT